MRCAVAGSRDPSWRDVCLTRGLGAQQQQPGGRPAGRPLAVSTAPALLPDPGPCCLPPRRPFPSLSRQAQCLVLSGCRAPTFTPLRGLGALGSCPVIVPFLSCHQAPSAPGGRGDWNEAQVPAACAHSLEEPAPWGAGEGTCCSAGVGPADLRRGCGSLDGAASGAGAEALGDWRGVPPASGWACSPRAGECKRTSKERS